MNQRFTDLLPWYVNGRIGAEDRAWVEAQLTAHPDWRAELQWHESLRAKVQADAAGLRDDVGLERALARIRAERPGPSPWQRLASWLLPVVQRPAFAMAAFALVLVQGGVISHLLGQRQDEAAAIRSSRAVAVDQRPMLKLNFTPEARESDIRMLLVRMQGRLVGGPGQLGDYYVAVPAGREAELAAQAKAETIVQAVELAPALPPQE